jgi:ribosomal protein L29
MADKKKTKKAQKLDITKLGVDELRTKLITLESDLTEAHKSHAARELANTNRLRELRKDIARINTALNTNHNEENA